MFGVCVCVFHGMTDSDFPANFGEFVLFDFSDFWDMTLLLLEYFKIIHTTLNEFFEQITSVQK